MFGTGAFTEKRKSKSGLLCLKADMRTSTSGCHKFDKTDQGVTALLGYSGTICTADLSTVN